MQVPDPESRKLLPPTGTNSQVYDARFSVSFRTPHVSVSRTLLFACECARR